MRPLINPRPEARAHGHRGGIWWANPLSPILILVVPMMLATYLIPSHVFLEQWKEPKFFGFDAMIRCAAAMVMFCIGALVATRGRLGLAAKLEWPGLSPLAWEVLRRSFFTLYRLTCAAYALWVGLALRNGLRPSTLLDTLRSQNTFSGTLKAQFVNVTGVTTLIELGIAASVVGALLAVQRDRGVSRRLAFLVLLATLRGFFLAERLAIIEVVLPWLVIRSGQLATTRARSARRILVRLGPIFAIPLLLVGFSLFEYSRSWSFAKTTTTDSFLQYSSYRLVGYYATSFNNGELYRITTDRTGRLPFDTVQFLWQAPGLSSVISYEGVTGTPPRPDVLGTRSNPEFNNPGGISGPFIDYSDMGGVLYFLLVGFVLGRLYVQFAAGRIVGLLLYPVFFVGVLEVPRYLYWAQGRVTPAIVALMLVGLRITAHARHARAMHLSLAA